MFIKIIAKLIKLISLLIVMLFHDVKATTPGVMIRI